MVPVRADARGGAGLAGGGTGADPGDADPASRRPPNELPPDPVADADPFGAPEITGLSELASWLSSADRVLRAVGASTSSASAVRCWPHHFDLAISIGLAEVDGPTRSARSIGVGLSPGDGSIGEPYWYVTPTPWLTPDGHLAAQPPLTVGHWHTQGWFGAVLTASELAVAHPSAAAGSRVVTFLAAALSVCRALLATPAPPRAS